ncbi:MAG: gliding motility-associated C-terminal domain-containing protein, partial [Flavobacteriales bacterium]|nr:gliding motility-associated C-terminal domain-containing protein [Flavobacteriales bacterium]
CNEDTLVLTDQSTTDILSNDALVTWNYTLADGNFIAQPSGTHIYADAGFYPVQLLVITNNGCRDSITRIVEVYPLPTVDLLAEPSEGCEPLFVQFQDATTIPAPYQLAAWQWNLGDTNAATVADPFFTYAPQNLQPNDTAAYTIGLIVTSTNGCVSSISYDDLIIVHPLPDALFSTDPNKVASVIRPIFEFTDLSTVNVMDWSWTFGDGNGSSTQNPTHAYPDSGSYTITLIVETQFACGDTISYTVKVEPNFSFYIPNAFTPDNDGVNDQFFGTGEYITQYNMQIFDRWGEKLFESNSQDLKWDGSYKGKQVEAGQYIYQFIVRDWEQVQHEYTGGVMVVR